MPTHNGSSFTSGWWLKLVSAGYPGRRAGFPLTALLVAAALAPPAGRAQTVIEPAPAIRVVESAGGWNAARERVVAEPLLPAEILSVQIALAEAGFDPGVRNGAPDAATRAALRRFQIARGLRICGCVNYETVVALAIVPLILESEKAASSVVYGYGDTGSYGVIILPTRRGKRGFGHATAGVFVGHEPAVGAGARKTPQPRSSVGVREIRPRTPQPRTPSRIRPGTNPR